MCYTLPKVHSHSPSYTQEWVVAVHCNDWLIPITILEITTSCTWSCRENLCANFKTEIEKKKIFAQYESNMQH